MSERPRPWSRSGFGHYFEIQTRWMDNDIYGHINNAVHYSYFDTAVNRYLIDSGALDIQNSAVVGLVVETGCSYFKEIAFPETIMAGLRVTRVGRSSVRFEVALFRERDEEAAAQGHFVHVYVDRETRKPVELPAELRTAVERLQPGHSPRPKN